MIFVSGLPETACGKGSTLEGTRNIRAQLPALFAELGIKRLLDAPCGDFNWMARTDLSMVDYIGADYDAAHVAATRTRASSPREFAPRSKACLRLDIVNNRLPEADLMLCRDFLQHLPNGDVHKVLANFQAGGIRWLLATSYGNADNDDLHWAGGFRRLNLRAPPFGLPAPISKIDDGAERVLALWDQASLP
jgi:hypothetical protein